ncbi:class I SAM-dependent methyltransferase [Ferviditalea candida]|uniref:Methyltransferase domain-containing protein n=1 Tax=Ferviditalea candida TaxID=3108399 RepID=A0ABU5ZLP1_9BACL|nr:methyltransferase domain-containing protein [Paenibacillaceae bacterium T2]
MNAFQERLLFLYKFSRAPKQIGSFTPSSVFLAKKMVAPIPWNQVKYVAELGAGTGAITKHIGRLKNHDARVLVFEKDPHLRERLADRFTSFTYHADACKLQSVMHSEGIEQLDCVLSGLPFFNFPQQLRDQLMNQILVSLKPGGLFVAFQYSQQMKKQLSQLFELEDIQFSPLNLPPAFVYICRKREKENSS